jgi:hypothetical protein
VSISELEALTPATDSQMANAVVASIDFDHEWRETAAATHHAAASFGVRGGTRSLESDLAYTRYLGQGSYRFDLERHHLVATGMAEARVTHRSSNGSRLRSPALRGWDMTRSHSPAATAWSIRRSNIATPASLFLDIRFGGMRMPLGRSASPRASGSRRPGIPGRGGAARHTGSSDRSARVGSPDSGSWDPVVVVPARRAAVVLLALLTWPAARSSAQTLTVDAVGDVLRIRAPGFSFLKGDPLARLKDGRSVRVELAAMVLPAPGKSPAATTRRIFALSYDLWEERFAVTAVDKRSQSVSHLMAAAAEA